MTPSNQLQVVAVDITSAPEHAQHDTQPKGSSWATIRSNVSKSKSPSCRAATRLLRAAVLLYQVT